MAYLTQYSSSVPVIKFNIDQTLMCIGQNIDMDICVPEDGLAENHAAVEAIKHSESYRFLIKSHEDDQLVELNGELVSQAELQDGDWVVIGGVEFQFTDDGVNEIKETVVSLVTENTTAISAEKVVVQDKQESEAMKMIKQIKEEVESITTEELDEDSHFSRRLNFF